MIVGPQPDPNVPGLTLDDLFRRAAVRNADALALADPNDRATFTGGASKTLTYAEADRAIWNTAARLRALGLSTDAVVAFQLPNTVESVITLLGILRAGMIAAPLPMLWREAEITSALSDLGAKALLTASHINGTDHCAIAMRAAASLFSIRHVCVFGRDLSGGVASFESVDSGDAPFGHRRSDEARHAAVVTFETTAHGPQPIVRNHGQIMAGAAAALGSRVLPADVRVLSALPLSSFAGLALTVLTWLRSGGALILHQPFDAEQFFAQQRVYECAILTAPARLAGVVASEIRRRGGALDTVLALWRAPEHPDRRVKDDALIDIEAIGEFALRGRARVARPADVAIPPILFTQRSLTGTLMLSGPMVAGAGPFGDISDAGAANAPIDTGYPCRIDNNELTVTASPAAMVGVGGYRIPRAEIDAVTASLPPGTIIAALPDALLGQRLIGTATDAGQAETSLSERGVTPLIGRAFTRRRAAA
jgi:hypothetical protein